LGFLLWAPANAVLVESRRERLDQTGTNYRRQRWSPSGRRGNRPWRADEYRRRAQQCLEKARTFGDHGARVTLAHMAQAWLRVADNCQDAK